MRPHRWQPTRLPRPWDSPGKNTGAGCHFFSNAWKWKVKVKSLSHVRLLATPWTAAHQAPPSMGFSRQQYWSRVPLPSLMWWGGEGKLKPAKLESFGIFCYPFWLDSSKNGEPLNICEQRTPQLNQNGHLKRQGLGLRVTWLRATGNHPG